MDEKYSEIKRYNYWNGKIDAFYHLIATKFGLSDSAMQILYILCEQGDGCNQSEVCRLAGTSKQTINTAIHKLEKQGLLFLEAGEGKNTRVFLTESGKVLVEEKIEPLIHAENEVMLGWKKEERELFIRLTQRYLEELKVQMKDLLDFPENQTKTIGQ